MCPYVRGNKTDRGDCAARLEAARNPKIRPVPVKSTEQQALMALHRVRAGG
jgi:transposase